MRTLLRIILVTIPLVANAQDADPEFKRLVTATTLRCNFDNGASAVWSNAKAKVELTSFGKDGQLTFDSINLKEGKARLIGNAGATDVHTLPTETGITFLERTGSGNLNITTVFFSTASNDKQSYLAVTSRHSSFRNPMPSQYYGSCNVLE